MFPLEDEIQVFRKTLKQVIKDLESIKDCPIKDLKDEVIDKFDRYSYDGEDEVVGFETWDNLANDGLYELMVRINHEDAYVFTLFVKVSKGYVSIVNVL